MNAIHGGKATHAKIDAHTLAVLLRGGMLPQASVYPAERRATRDLLRRRMSLTRKRAELLGHVQNTKSQDNLPEIGKKLAYKANRTASLRGSPTLRSRKAWQWTWRLSTTTIISWATWSDTSSKRLSSTMPRRSTCSKRCLALATS
jgi:hypothetical protein